MKPTMSETSAMQNSTTILRITCRKSTSRDKARWTRAQRHIAKLTTLIHFRKIWLQTRNVAPSRGTTSNISTSAEWRARMMDKKEEPVQSHRLLLYLLGFKVQVILCCFAQWFGTTSRWGGCQSCRQEDQSTGNPDRASCDRWRCCGRTPAMTNEEVAKIQQGKNVWGSSKPPNAAFSWPRWHARDKRPSSPRVHHLFLRECTWHVWNRVLWESEEWCLSMRRGSFFSQ